MAKKLAKGLFVGSAAAQKKAPEADGAAVVETPFPATTQAEPETIEAEVIADEAMPSAEAVAEAIKQARVLTNQPQAALAERQAEVDAVVSVLNKGLPHLNELGLAGAERLVKAQLKMLAPPSQPEVVVLPPKQVTLPPPAAPKPAATPSASVTQPLGTPVLKPPAPKPAVTTPAPAAKAPAVQAPPQVPPAEPKCIGNARELVNAGLPGYRSLRLEEREQLVQDVHAVTRDTSLVEFHAAANDYLRGIERLEFLHLDAMEKQAVETHLGLEVKYLRNDAFRTDSTRFSNRGLLYAITRIVSAPGNRPNTKILIDEVRALLEGEAQRRDALETARTGHQQILPPPSDPPVPLPALQPLGAPPPPLPATVVSPTNPVETAPLLYRPVLPPRQFTDNEPHTGPRTVEDAGAQLRAPKPPMSQRKALATVAAIVLGVIAPLGGAAYLVLSGQTSFFTPPPAQQAQPAPAPTPEPPAVEPEPEPAPNPPPAVEPAPTPEPEPAPPAQPALCIRTRGDICVTDEAVTDRTGTYVSARRVSNGQELVCRPVADLPGQDWAHVDPSTFQLPDQKQLTCQVSATARPRRNADGTMDFTGCHVCARD